MIDWIKNFEVRFDNDKEINSLKAKKFNGNIQIHFNLGLPLRYRLELWGTGKITSREYGDSPTQTKGRS